MKLLRILALGLLLAGCGGDPLSCAAGTIEKDGACVVVGKTGCGAGTTLQDGVCVPVASDTVGTDVGSTDVADTATGDTATGDTATGDTATGDTATGDTADDTAGGDAAGDTAVGDTDDGGAADADSADGGPPACLPYCLGKSCGDDGCGGSCGTCKDAAAPFCDEFTGSCKAICVPQCLGKQCGDDGCGGSCGGCSGGTNCSAAGKCLPPAWTCDPSWYGGGNDPCDCGCGALDPDCKLPGNAVSGCKPLQICDGSGVCVDNVPAGWTCSPVSYGAQDACNCGCGVADPDCKLAGMGVVGCANPGATCDDKGQCVACKPDCTGKSCGDDGCGGFCGVCESGSKTSCIDGTCVDPCSPKPLKCEFASCGSDGCGGSCGSCKTGESCVAGTCKSDVVPKDSCKGNCGSTADSGCGCFVGCETNGGCCADYAAECSCKPSCDGKTCGDDGCGGSCGSCTGDKAYCAADGKCTATCPKQCGGKQCGDDGCGGSCGNCTGDELCNADGRCVAKGWFCASTSYGDGQGCDCGCGALDPDCSIAKVLVLGCPTATTTCKAPGICDVGFCKANADCAQGQWCTGLYAKGGGSYAGTCGPAQSDAKAPGLPCQSGFECATGVCLGGQCRLHCEQDAACPNGQLCVGMPVYKGAYGAKSGYTGVCALVDGSNLPCKAQKDCTAYNQTCVALVDPKTFGPALVCANTPGAPALGSSCATWACAGLQLCANTSKGALCTLPCPGGDADCPTGWTCGKTALHDNGTSNPADDPQVDACLPK